jgi:hypothetical protein
MSNPDVTQYYGYHTHATVGQVNHPDRWWTADNNCPIPIAVQPSTVLDSIGRETLKKKIESTTNTVPIT